MDAVVAITRLGGVRAYRPLVAQIGRRALEKALAEGEVIRVRRGVYALPAANEAAVAAQHFGGVVSHLSAALAHGWKVKTPSLHPHVTVPRNSRRSSGAVRLHYVTLGSRRSAGSSPPRCGPPLTVPGQPFDEALAVVDSALRAIALGVPGFRAEPQGPVPGVGHADVADVRLKIALEAESWEFHALREAFNYDIRRYTAMVRRGWLVARFTWDDVMHKPD